jgi:hypothetical protein
MKLVSEDLKTTLTQTITIADDRVHHIDAVKIRLLMYNAPAGTFTLSLKEGATTYASKSFTSADIKSDLSTADNYAHLYKAIQFDYTVPLNAGSYDFVLSHSGYTYSGTSFIGWIKSHENIFNTRTDALNTILDNPQDILLYEKKIGGL